MVAQVGLLDLQGKLFLLARHVALRVPELLPVPEQLSRVRRVLVDGAREDLWCVERSVS